MSTADNVIQLTRTEDKKIGSDDLYDFAKRTLEGIGESVKRILIIPPDYSRSHSYGGKLTAIFYALLKDRCDVTIMPALGTHAPMAEEEITEFFGNEIPMHCFKAHNWRKDVVNVGEVPSDFVKEATKGLFDRPIRIEINRMLLANSLDAILSVGQVVPHEVAGMANYSKNILVGCGGEDIINQSHIIGAAYGMEKIIGRADNPVRMIFDYAQKHYLEKLNIWYVLTVTNVIQDHVELEGIFAGRQRSAFEKAARCSAEKNIYLLDRPVKNVVAYLDEKEFKSTWLGNKAIYRTRMAIADGGKLTILAPGVKTFGEDAMNDSIIRKYGYSGRESILNALNNEDMKANLSAAAHLIHGSNDGRFQVEYAVRDLAREDVEAVNYTYIAYDEAMRKYHVDRLFEGYNHVDGEEIFFVKKPALGLWAFREMFNAQ